MNSEDKGYLDKNNNAIKDNASGWVLTTSSVSYTHLPLPTTPYV